jgi:outer membrane protein TolC
MLTAAAFGLLLVPMPLTAQSNGGAPWWRDPAQVERLISPRPGTPWSGEHPIPAVGPRAVLELPDPKRPLTLAELTDLALINNPLTRQAWLSARAAADSVGVETADYFPQVAGTLAWARLRTATPLGVPLPAITRYGPTITLSHLLLDFGARAAQLEAAQFNLLAANLTQNRMLQTVVASVEQAYYALLGFEALVRSAQLHLKSAQTTLDATERRRQGGLATIGDVFRAEAAVAQARLALQQSQGGVARSRGQLATAIGVPVNAAFTLAPMPERPPVVEVRESVDTLLELARRARPDLIAAEAGVRAARANVRAVRALSMPTLTANALWAETEFSGRPHPIQTWQLGLAVNVPLFTGFRDLYATQLARTQAERSEAVRDALANQVELDVWQSYFHLQTAAEGITTAESLVRSTAQAAMVAAARYREGVGNLLELLIAQSEESNARTQQIQAALTWYTALSALNLALGSLPHQPLVAPGAATPVSGPPAAHRKP